MRTPIFCAQWNVLAGPAEAARTGRRDAGYHQRCYRFNHQKMADWRGCGRSNLP